MDNSLSAKSREGVVCVMQTLDKYVSINTLEFKSRAPTSITSKYTNLKEGINCPHSLRMQTVQTSTVRLNYFISFELFE